jgi:signal transduction histidine kinase
VLAPSLWPALVDATQIEVAILNLSINARDAMPVGGRVVIATKNIPAGAGDLPPELRPGDYVLVSVTDSGEGMSPETLAKAFDPCSRPRMSGRAPGWVSVGLRAGPAIWRNGPPPQQAALREDEEIGHLF